MAGPLITNSNDQPFRLIAKIGKEEQKAHDDKNSGGYNHTHHSLSLGYKSKYLFGNVFLNLVSSDIKDLGSWKQQAGIKIGPRLTLFNALSIEPYVGIGFERGEYNYGNTTIPSEEEFFSYMYGARLVLSTTLESLPISPLIMIGTGKEHTDTYTTTGNYAGIGFQFGTVTK